MRRWDLLGGLLGLATAVLDLAAFGWVGLDVASLAASVPGVMVLAGFVLGYGAVGFVSGRLYLARERSRADARQIAAQLEALEQSRLQLAQSEKLAALGRLAAGIAHEVRNPLGIIKASASMVQEGLDGGTDDHRACALIVDEVDRLDGLIGALLAFAKPARMALTATPVAPVLERASTLAREAREGLDVALDAGPELAVRADADLLTQLVLGLLVNAAEAGARRVEVRAERRGRGVRIAVHDDGPGVREEDAARVFEPFFTTKEAGTGLGLSMAARIVEAHGGQIELEPSEGGACFTITLPTEGPAVEAVAA